MRSLWRFLASLKTCAWLGLLFTLSGVAGSVLMGRHPEIFSDMDAQVFAGWFARKGFAAPAASLWLYGLLLSVALLAVNAACCTAERLAQILRGKVTLRRLLPHVMHLAFLGVVLSHLVSATRGDRVVGIQVPQGQVAPVGATGMALGFDGVHVVMSPEGPPKDYAAAVTVYRDSGIVARAWLRPNEPLFHEGYGFHLKNFGQTPWGAPYGEFDANRDPGAVPILLCSLLFTAANLLYLLPAGRTEQGRVEPAEQGEQGEQGRSSEGGTREFPPPEERPCSPLPGSTPGPDGAESAGEEA